MKRIVTGHDSSGKSVFVSTSEPGHVVEAKAMKWYELWTTFADANSMVQAPLKEPTRDARWTSVYPGLGQTIFRILEFRPEEYDASSGAPLWSEAETARLRQQLPGMLEHLEPDSPGMHATATVDYGVVLSGRIVLELDDGANVELAAGDVVVQNGTRHAWRPLERTLMAFVLVGAHPPAK